MDLTLYYSVLRTEKAALDKNFPSGFCFVTSNDHFAQVAEVSNAIAARSIAENKARISSGFEIEKFKQAGATFSARMASQQFARKKSDSSGVTFTLTK